MIEADAEFHRDDGKISHKYGDTIIRTLRETYGGNFAPFEDTNSRLAAVLHRLDEPSLLKLVNDLDGQRQLAL
jgi:hypothetical protein